MKNYKHMCILEEFIKYVSVSGYSEVVKHTSDKNITHLKLLIPNYVLQSCAMKPAILETFYTL